MTARSFPPLLKRRRKRRRREDKQSKTTSLQGLASTHEKKKHDPTGCETLEVQASILPPFFLFLLLVSLASFWCCACCRSTRRWMRCREAGRGRGMARTPNPQGNHHTFGSWLVCIWTWLQKALNLCMQGPWRTPHLQASHTRWSEPLLSPAHPTRRTSSRGRENARGVEGRGPGMVCGGRTRPHGSAQSGYGKGAKSRIWKGGQKPKRRQNHGSSPHTHRLSQPAPLRHPAFFIMVLGMLLLIAAGATVVCAGRTRLHVAAQPGCESTRRVEVLCC